MPIYLAHGFRWPRDGFTGIRVHAIINRLDDVSVEYIQTSSSRSSILTSLRTLYPTILKNLETSGRALDFIEQYDPEDISAGAVSQPYAFVCDWIVMIAGGNDAERHASNLLQSSKEKDLRPASPKAPAKIRAKTQPMSIAQPFNSPATQTALSVNMEEIISDSPPLSTEAWEALADLRDKLADGEKIGWWVVYNGDPDRYYPESEEEDDEAEERDGEETVKEFQPDRSIPAHAESSQRSSATLPSNQPAPVPAGDQLHRVRSPTGGRMPPPVPPGPHKTPRSPTQAASVPLPIRPPQIADGSETQKSDAKPKVAPKSPGLRKKIFGKK